MSKKIKLQIRDGNNLEFTILESAEKGDYISLNEINEINLDPLKEHVAEMKETYLKEQWEENKARLLESSDEYVKLRNDIQEFEKKYTILKEGTSKSIELAESKISQELNSKIEKLTFEKTSLEKEHSDKIDLAVSKIEKDLIKEKTKYTILEEGTSKSIELAESRVSQELNSKIEKLTFEKTSLEKEHSDKIDLAVSKIEKDLNEKITKLESENSHKEVKHNLDIKNAKYEIADEWRGMYDEKNRELEELMRIKSNYGSKNIGEDLENYLQSQFGKAQSFMEQTSFEKTTIAKNGGKPDFLFEVRNTDQSIITSAVIEAKSGSVEKESKQKNNSFYKRLDFNRKNFQSEYSILVTELERNDEFIIKRIWEYENMFIVRPEALPSLLSMIYTLAQKKKEINSLQVDMKEKQNILIEFEEIKTDILNKSVRKLNDNIKEIEHGSQKIIVLANKQIDKASKATAHLTTIENKMNSFKINKIIDKMDALNNK